MFQKTLLNIKKYSFGGKNWGKNTVEQVLKQNNPLKINELLFIVGCPTWIRTKTNCTKNSRTTIILSGNPMPFLEWSAKIGFAAKFSK